MASSTTVSKIKLKENGNPNYSTFQIKDQWVRERKLDKDNPTGSGYINLNGGGKAPGANSISLGYKNNATGNSAAAIGSQNEANGEFSISLGLKNKTLYPYQFVTGKFNLPLQEDLFEIGNGDNDAARANIFRITKDGKIYTVGDIFYNGTISIAKKIETIENNIINNEYTLPSATKTRLGGIVIGDNIDVDKDGKISVTFPEASEYKLPPATIETLGGVRIGENIQIAEDGTISVIFPDIPEEYVLPQATATKLGGIKIAENMGFRLNDGVLTYAVNKMNQENPEGTGYIRMNTSGDIGLYSVSLGKSNIAAGANSIALGKDNQSKLSTSITLGNANISEGENAIAFGRESQASADNSVAGGIQASVAASNSLSLGYYTEANYEQQFVIGKYNNNQENNIFEIGIGTPAERKNGLAILNTGDVYIDKNIYFHKENDKYINIFDTLNTLITEPDYELPIASIESLGGIKVGENLTIDENGVLSANVKFSTKDLETTGYFSHNRVDVTNIGFNSFASNSSAIATKSTAFGNNTQAGLEVTSTRKVWDEATQTYIDEEYTYIDGMGSFAEGFETTTGGSYSHAAGYKTIANEQNQFVIGVYNDNKKNSIFEVGNGDEINGRKNAFSVDNVGNVYVQTDLFISNKSIFSPASTESFGMIKIGKNLEITEEGFLNALATGANKSLTQIEYDTLTEEEKNKDIIYFITDKQKIYYKNVEYLGGGSSSAANITLTTEKEYNSIVHKKDMIYFVSSVIVESYNYFIKDGKILVPEENYLYTKDSGSGELQQEVIGTDSNKYTTINWNSEYSNNGTSLIYKLKLPTEYSKVTFNIGTDTIGEFIIFYGKDSTFWNVINNNSTNISQTHTIKDGNQYSVTLENLPESDILYVGIGICTGCKLYIKDIFFEK